MSVIRKIALHNVRNIARNGFKAPIVTRSFSSVLERKEHADEAKYIRDIEHRRKEEIRANLERILALEDSHEEKTNLVELLEKKEPTGFLQKLGLDDWKYALPVGVLVGVPMVTQEFLIIDAEFQLTACFILFCSTMYNQVGGMMGKGLDEYSSEIEKNLRSFDDVVKDQLVTAIQAEEIALTLSDDTAELNALKDNMRVVQAESLTNQVAHDYREAVVKKLDALYALEESASNAIRSRMISKVQNEVIETFKNDRKAKDNALNAAIAVLSGGANAKLGKDVVGELFSASLVNYKEAYAKLPAGADEILVKLEEDMKAIGTAPAIDSKGGNVYITHPI